eukprot:gnl/MRDRNA2_/MRDRNA2_77139_c0_seq2.p1 gnl/MRDRNA2_/MRDRNA2_77139_c0~~gnl/MRDRNA2_/MRDRNA2_77139_c0_seq2.p1  ORF type:complete len:390 (-),score=101.27 gnl/MRDRNA2_/MRDRNA2_77139_c0_seq2:46-1215(-)
MKLHPSSVADDEKKPKKPKEGDEILVSYKLTLNDGTIKDDKQNVTYIIGTDAAGPLSKAMDKALTTMKKADVCKLTCKSKYLYDDGNDGIIDLTLHQIFETKDVSWAQDESVMKKTVHEGEGDVPLDCSKVTVALKDMTAGGTSVLKGGEQTLQFTLGNGEYSDLFECACASMRKGEEAHVTCSIPDFAVDEKLGLPKGMELPVVAHFTLKEIDRAATLPQVNKEMSEEEKMTFAMGRKEVATNLFKNGRLWLALRLYSGLAVFLGAKTSFKPGGRKQEAEALRRICLLNKAACCLKVGDPSGAKKSCTEVLKDEAHNIKALFRRAQASLALKNYSESIDDLKLLLEQEGESNNVEAKRLLALTQKSQKEERKGQKDMCANMLQGLGRK